MTGNDRTQNEPVRALSISKGLLYSLVVCLAAIAGFLSIVVADRFGASNSTHIERINTNTATAPASLSGSSGMEKLVRSDPAKPLPPFTFADEKGKDRRLDEWKGKIVLVNLWATWCAPCKVEMPGLDSLQARLGGADFAVVPISLDWSGPDKPREFLRSNQLNNLGLFLDNGKTLMQALNAPGLPLTVILDREGREIARLAGAAEWDSSDAIELLGGLIAN